MIRMKLDQLAVKAEPYKKALVIGVGVAFFGGLAIFGGVWALVIAAICLVAGILLGLVCGIAISDRDHADRINTLEANYAAASELAYKLNEELHAAAQRAETAERDLITTVAEKTSLRARLDAAQRNGTS